MKRPKGQRSGGLVAKIAASALSVYVIVVFFSVSGKVEKARAGYAELEQTCAQRRQEVSQLKDLIASPLDEDYIIRTAREKFGYVLPGERVYIDINGK